jgi:hypothetical protein
MTYFITLCIPNMIISRLTLACLLFLSYRSFQASAVPALLVPKALATPIPKISTTTTSSTSLALIHSIHFGKREPTPPTISSTKLLGEVLCTKATVTVISTKTSVLTKTHTVTERVVGPTRVGAEKRGVCLECTPLTKSHSKSTTSTTTHKKTTAPALAITRRVEERAECTDCLTAGIIPAVLNVKTALTSATKSTQSKPKPTPKATTASSSTSAPGLIHSIHFYRRAAPAFEDFP